MVSDGVVGEDAIAVRLSVKSRSVVVVGEDANNGKSTQLLSKNA